MNMHEFVKNRQQFPPEELLKYAGRYVAWSPDGTQIIASDEDMLRLNQRLKAAGHDMSETLIAMVPADDLILGAGGPAE